VSALVTLEQAVPGISTVQLAAVASALDLDPDALRRGESLPLQAPSVFLRHHGMQDFHDADLVVLDKAIEQGRALVALARLLGEDTGLWPSGAFQTCDAPGEGTAQHAYALADDLRRQIGLPTQPLGDVRKLAEEQLGIAVLVRQLATPGIGAVSIKVRDSAAIVLSAATLRHRAPMARVYVPHELCHVLHDPDDGGVHVVIDHEIDTRTHRAEQRARAFAAEALLPIAGLRARLGEPRGITAEGDARRLVALARDAFGTSWPIAANHLCNRGFIDLSLRPWLEALDGPRAGNAWDTRQPPVDGPSLLVRERTRRAHDAGVITDGDARDLLGLDDLQPLPW
jgi:Zn-dependent peptidase ImmA (M78 family)